MCLNYYNTSLNFVPEQREKTEYVNMRNSNEEENMQVSTLFRMNKCIVVL
jgi:hypothetical protein